MTRTLRAGPTGRAPTPRGKPVSTREALMGIGVGSFLIALGAIVAFAVEFTAGGIDLNAVGVILMVVGGLGVVLSMIFWSSWGGFGRRRSTVVDTPVRRRVDDDVIV